MAGIVTLTMNPAVDLSTSVDRVEPLRKLRCHTGRRDPGGGGINVARVIARFGADVTAVYPVGGALGQLLQRLVQDEGIKSLTIPVLGETREDITVSDAATGQQYRFVLPGPALDRAEWTECLNVFAALRPDFVCASGSLPPGVPDDFYARVAKIVAGWGAKFILDSSGAALNSALEERVYLIKPNLREMRELVGAALDEQGSRIDACRSLIARGAAEIVALTLGADGALLVTSDRAWQAQPLPVKPASTVGAGDSFLGAMVWALTSKMSLEESFRYAVAAGSAALLAPGTELCRPQDVRDLLSQVVIQDLPDRRAAAVCGRPSRV
ncbi:MAG TPA: 1-phosphofructokinase family hexose kinase [Methylovirgula sp.]|nr:1-phosphofructokinase family hexose kinase [Methylovirgula sp.]